MHCVTERRSTRGFTLAELMIAIAVMAVFISLASSYAGFGIRAKVSECVNNATEVKWAIEEYRQIHGEWPPSLEATGKSNAGTSQYCNAIKRYQNATGSFTVDVNEPAIDLDLVHVSPDLVPNMSQGNVITWDCVAAETRPEEIVYLPATCRDGSNW